MAELVWVRWDRDEPEDGLLGFYNQIDRDEFSAGRRGPFRRVVSPDGRTISQMDDWKGMLKRWTEE